MFALVRSGDVVLYNSNEGCTGGGGGGGGGGNEDEFAEDNGSIGIMGNHGA